MSLFFVMVVVLEHHDEIIKLFFLF